MAAERDSAGVSKGAAVNTASCGAGSSPARPLAHACLKPLQLEGGPCDGWPEKGFGARVFMVPLTQLDPPVRGVAKREDRQFEAVYDRIEGERYAFRGVREL